MRVGTLGKWTDFRGEVVAISRAISAAQAHPLWERDSLVRIARATIKHSMHVRDVETRSTRRKLSPL